MTTPPLEPPVLQDATCSLCGHSFAVVVDPRTCPTCKRMIVADNISRLVRTAVGELLGGNSGHCVIFGSTGVSLVGVEGTVHLTPDEVRVLERLIRRSTVAPARNEMLPLRPEA